MFLAVLQIVGFLVLLYGGIWLLIPEPHRETVMIVALPVIGMLAMAYEVGKRRGADEERERAAKREEAKRTGRPPIGHPMAGFWKDVD